MKKTIIATIVVFTSGILSLYINNKNVTPSSAVVKLTFYDYKKELGSGD